MLPPPLVSSKSQLFDCPWCQRGKCREALRSLGAGLVALTGSIPFLAGAVACSGRGTHHVFRALAIETGRNESVRERTLEVLARFVAGRDGDAVRRHCE